MNQANSSVLLYVTGLSALGMAKPVDLSLPQGNVCMLSGESGTGKSQFLKAIADLIKHQGGVSLMGLPQAKTSPELWRSEVMYFAAETAWWLDEVASHFETLPTEEQLAQLGLKPKVLQASPDSLSSGEKQRLALLRGLQYKPKVLLLDEITANLDPHSESKVERLLQDYIEVNQAAAIWVSHNAAQIERMATQTLHFEVVHEGGIA